MPRSPTRSNTNTKTKRDRSRSYSGRDAAYEELSPVGLVLYHRILHVAPVCQLISDYALSKFQGEYQDGAVLVPERGRVVGVHNGQPIVYCAADGMIIYSFDGDSQNLETPLSYRQITFITIRFGSVMVGVSEGYDFSLYRWKVDEDGPRDTSAVAAYRDHECLLAGLVLSKNRVAAVTVTFENDVCLSTFDLGGDGDRWRTHICTDISEEASTNCVASSSKEIFVHTRGVHIAAPGRTAAIPRNRILRFSLADGTHSPGDYLDADLSFSNSEILAIASDGDDHLLIADDWRTIRRVDARTGKLLQVLRPRPIDDNPRFLTALFSVYRKTIYAASIYDDHIEIMH